MSELHPKGFFEAEVLEHGLSESRTKKTPQLVVNFKTVEGEIRGFFYITEKTIENVVKTIRTLGFRGNKISELNSSVLVGNRCSISIDHEDYQGKTRAKVGFVNEIGYDPSIIKDVKVGAVLSKYDSVLKAEPVIEQAASEEVEEAPFH